MKVMINKAQRVESPASPVGDLLLDSSLIVTTTLLSLYQIKIIICNNYIQVYELENSKTCKNQSLEKITHKKSITSIDTDNLKIEDNQAINNDTPKIENDIIISDDNLKRFRCRLDKIQKKYICAPKYQKQGTMHLKTIERKNITRSKLECQRLAKCNANDWKTFITLTFAANITDIQYANKRFRYLIDKIQRKYKELKYICVPEFQDRGAAHYHLLTNIDINNSDLIYAQQDNKKFKHIKYWNDGFTKVEQLHNDIKKVVGYISKYMTKDIDNRLYNRHRYFYSRNLIKPKISYLNLQNPLHKELYEKLLSHKKMIYENVYQNSYDNTKIAFKEYL